jgi:CubicO group peptidase (beta-lactamase class C family)
LTARHRHRVLARRALVGTALLGGAGVAAMGIDLAVAAALYGPEYAWRVVAWRNYHPDDGDRFPARSIAASPRPLTLPPDPAGAAPVRAAFTAASGTDDLEVFATRTHTTSLLVLRDGRLAFEGYFNGSRRDTPQGSFSMAKSVTSLLVGAAIADGVMPGIDILAETLLPDVPRLRGSGIRVRHLLTMTSGFSLDDAGPVPGPLGGPWKDWRLMYFAPDLRQVARAVRPVHPPGTVFQYDDRNAMLLGLMLEHATREHVSTYLERRLWQPMGAAFNASWSLDGRASGFEKMESGINARPLDYAKLGLLVLRGGMTERGERLLPTSWIDASTQATPILPGWTKPPGEAYGLLWWLFPRRDAPNDAFADGIFGQELYVSRATGVVILRTGTSEVGTDWPALIHRWVHALASG